MWIKELKLIVFAALFFFVSSATLAQEEEKSECVLKLEQAQEKYNQGRIQDVEPLIGQCIRGDEFNKVDKAQALKLLTLSYIFLKEQELAEVSMLELLKANHEFEINETIDPSEFINLYNKYRSDPLLSVGVLGGVTFAQPIVRQLNSTQDVNESPRQSYTPKLGFRGGFNVEYRLTSKIFLNPGINITHVAFEKTNQALNTGTGTYYGEFTGALGFNSLELPLFAQYQFLDGKVRPYALAGVVPQLYTSASYPPGDATKNSIEGSPEVTSNSLNLSDDLKRFNLAVSLGAGLKVKVAGGFFNARLRYSYGLFTTFKESSALNPQNPDLLWELGESLDGFTIQDLSISIGYTYHIFIPKKLR